MPKESTPPRRDRPPAGGVREDAEVRRQGAEQDRQQAEGVREKAEGSRQNAEQDRGLIEEQRTVKESGRNEAEQFRRLLQPLRTAARAGWSLLRDVFGALPAFAAGGTWFRVTRERGISADRPGP